MARVLLFGGLDPSGGAGLTLDAAVVAMHAGEPLPIALANTVQNQQGFRCARAVDERLWQAQLEAVLADGAVGAIKVGFVGCVAGVAALATVLRDLAEHAAVVVDPVLSATAGGFAPPTELARAYRERLLPLATLVTPNAPELAALAAGDAANLLATGVGAVLRKGGHVDGDEVVDELWLAGEPPQRFARPRLACGEVRGTGCALAAAISCHLANGRPLAESCRLAGDWLAGLLARVRPRPNGRPRPLPLSRA
ncbi:MAG TPA: hydroxymethylpyrimidine/phosphomethylpyrimidine kinase [bacterium]|nr:hydroxymethylpyrimidine/phosphomethylpyrimidine kinase [bacterium]